MGWPLSTARAAGEIQLCLEQHPVQDSFVQAPSGQMPVHVPAGTVFNYAGHAFGPAADPLDRAHANPDGDGWRGISSAEETRRRNLQMEDIGGDGTYHRPAGRPRDYRRRDPVTQPPLRTHGGQCPPVP